MARRKIQSDDERSLSGDVKTGVIVVILVTLAILSILGFFHAAGIVGFYSTKYLRVIFGSGYFLFPLFLLLVSYSLISSRNIFGSRKLFYASAVLLLLTVYALLHLKYPLEDSIEAAKHGVGGGFAGVILAWFLLYALGTWGALVILISLLLMSIIVMLNISLQSLFKSLEVIKMAARHSARAGVLIKDKAGAYLRKNKGEEETEEEYEEEAEAEEDNNFFGRRDLKMVALDDEPMAEETTEPVKQKKARVIDIPLNLLDNKSEKPKSRDIEDMKIKIERTLENFNIGVVMNDINIGPTVTQYTLKPAEGIRVSQITSLNDNLALALAAHPIRIEAPIPGKSLVGIEVPNQKIATVRLRELLESDAYKKRPHNLVIPLGKDVSGEVMITDLSRMPHLLIAGATGSGKTICINSIILSLLYQNSPDLLKLILVDPKRVELPVYNNIPHLLAPVITDVKKTIKTLKWAISEMEQRFETLSEAKSRDINSYNASHSDKMPYIVVVIDELADLMASAGAEIEAAVIRLAQMSRAVGIHLILATQRPSVNVITGLIKANINARVAFSVASVVDSRTILDSGGAEKLLGRGDMLFINAELGKPRRLQGAYISEQEVKSVANFLKTQAEVEYDEGLKERLETKSAGAETIDYDDKDYESVEEAKEIILKAKKASATLLQRHLRIGYSKAARILDILEAQGVIGPADGAKPREILIVGDVPEEEDDDQGETVFG